MSLPKIMTNEILHLLCVPESEMLLQTKTHNFLDVLQILVLLMIIPWGAGGGESRDVFRQKEGNTNPLYLQHRSTKQIAEKNVELRKFPLLRKEILTPPLKAMKSSFSVQEKLIFFFTIIWRPKKDLNGHKNGWFFCWSNMEIK